MIRSWSMRSLLLLGALFLAMPIVGAYEECEVSSSAKQINAIEGHSYTNYTFEVTLEIEEQCARISYALVIDERLEDGELRKKTFPRTLVMRSNAVTEYQDYKTRRAHVIEGVSVEGMRCSVCL